MWRTWFRIRTPQKKLVQQLPQAIETQVMFILQNRQAGAFDELSVDASYLVCLLWAISLSPRINHVHVCLFVCVFVCLKKYVLLSLLSFEPFLSIFSFQAFHVSLELKKQQLQVQFSDFTSLLFYLVKSEWWFQIFLILLPIWGRFPFWLIFFQRGWNHQVEVL